MTDAFRVRRHYEQSGLRSGGRHRARSLPLDFSGSGGVSAGRVYGLLSDLGYATKIAKAARRCHFEIHNCDRADVLLDAVRRHKPVVIIFDWDGREAESYKVLAALAKDPELKGIASVGYVSASNRSLQSEAQKAGCHRVYAKTDFLKQLDDVLMRFAL